MRGKNKGKREKRGEKKRREGKGKCFCPVSNRGPFACEANVITTTLQKRCASAAAPGRKTPAKMGDFG